MSIGNITENYGDRIKRLVLFEPLYKLEKKESRDNSGNKIDYFSLGLLTLLFFFENMLVRNKKTGIQELAVFLQELNQGEMDLTYEGFEKAARTIIEIFRPSTGKRNSKEFYNWETRKKEVVQYSILKADMVTNSQYYTLDEQGLELVFATKEYFNEFQLSINQLVLRKQLEKGEFVGALRQIDEIKLDVKSLQDRIVRIKHEVNRNIVSTETYERYKSIIEDINMRLQREDEKFNELQFFVKETKEKIGNEIVNDKDRRALELIILIDKELGQVHFEHRLLFKESIVLKTSALNAAQEALYYVGIDSFNFDQEITSRLFSSPLPLNSVRTLIEPFLYLEKYESWSPLTVFTPQRIEREERVESSKDFLMLPDEVEIKLDVEITRKNFKFIMEIILEAMDEQNHEISIQEVVQFIKEKSLDEILNKRTFYDFWIILHQKSPVTINSQEKNEELLFGEALNLLSNEDKLLYVEEAEETIEINNRFSIKNMRFRLEDNHASI